MCKKWLIDNAVAIQSFGALAGLVVGIGGFAFMGVQLVQTNKSFQAANTYLIQKDSRALVDKIKDNQEFRDAIQTGISPENEAAFLDNLWVMLNFYLSVYRQETMEGVTTDFVKSFKADFCQFIALPAPSEGWTKLETSNRIGNTHNEMRRTWCGEG